MQLSAQERELSVGVSRLFRNGIQLVSCRRFEYLTEVDGEDSLAAFEIANERVADIAILERVNV